MRIYKPLHANDYECLNCDNDDDYEVFNTFDGTSRLTTWRPIQVRRHSADDRQKGLPSDFPWLGSDVLVMRTRAIVALRDILDAHGELLPLADDEIELFAFNAHAVDALDEPRSSIMRFPGSDRIMYVDKVAFVEDKVRGLDMFRLTYRGSPTYVSERFVVRVEEAELSGLAFDKVATVA